MTRVMISYSTKRSSVATALHARLRDVYRLHPRLDQLDLSAGDRWRESIASWLSTCDTAVVLLCPDALRSPWVRYELSVLANRELAEKNLRLVLVCLGGVKRSAVARRRSFIPCRLGELQVMHEYDSLELTDEQLEALAGDIAVSALEGGAGGAPLDALMARVSHEVHHLDASALAEASARFPAAADGAVDHSWDLQSFVPATADEAQQQRRAFAARYCIAPLKATTKPLDHLIKLSDFTMEHAERLMTVSQQADVDSRSISKLNSLRARPPAERCVVFGATDPESVKVAARAVDVFHDTGTVYVRVVHGGITGANADQVAESIVEQFKSDLLLSGETPEEWLGDMDEDDHPVFLVLKDMEGATPDVLRRVTEKLEPLAGVVIASAERPVHLWREALGLDSVGPDLIGEAWLHFVSAEAERLAEPKRLYKKLERARTEAGLSGVAK